LREALAVALEEEGAAVAVALVLDVVHAHKFIPNRSFVCTTLARKIGRMSHRYDLAVLYEHPEWQKPLFAALERRGIRYAAVDLKKAAFSDTDEPLAWLYFNQASPSAYARGNTRAVPYALAYMRALQARGVGVLKARMPSPSSSARPRKPRSCAASACPRRAYGHSTTSKPSVRGRTSSPSRCCSSRSRAAAGRASSSSTIWKSWNGC
jgi:hypothetical protein